MFFLKPRTEKLLSFYGDNRFHPFDRRIAERRDKEPHELKQLLRLLQRGTARRYLSHKVIARCFLKECIQDLKSISDSIKGGSFE